MLNSARMLVVIVGLLVFTPTPAQKLEKHWTAEWCAVHGLAYEGPGLRLKTHTGLYVFVDCISDKVVVEVDKARNYKEGIGQALTYGVLSGRKHVILLLIIEKERDCNYYRDTERILRESFLRIHLAQVGNYHCRGLP